MDTKKFYCVQCRKLIFIFGKIKPKEFRCTCGVINALIYKDGQIARAARQLELFDGNLVGKSHE